MFYVVRVLDLFIFFAISHGTTSGRHSPGLTITNTNNNILFGKMEVPLQIYLQAGLNNRTPGLGLNKIPRHFLCQRKPLWCLETNERPWDKKVGQDKRDVSCGMNSSFFTCTVYADRRIEGQIFTKSNAGVTLSGSLGYETTTPALTTCAAR